MTRQFELSTIDRHFAEFICRKAECASPWLGLAASLVSNAVGQGHICISLAGIAGQYVEAGGKGFHVPEWTDVRRVLESTSVVGQPGDFRPLVLDGEGRLYLYRYWKYEQDLARIILGKAADSCAVDEGLLRNGLQRLFPPGDDGGTDWQKLAAAVALRRRFCVISGGPGTGKTSTVVKILALLLEQSAEKILVAMAAPTGKSAARLKESLLLMKQNVNCAAGVRERIPEEVTTTHRLLGAMGESRRFRYSEDNRLPHDVVIVDEASMVSLPLMARLAAALKRDCRLILLGDRDQLASVEAGAVLGDICGGGRQVQYSKDFGAFVARVTDEQIPGVPAGDSPVPLADSLVVLRKNYRFKSDSGIGALAAAVNAGEPREAVAALKGNAGAGVFWHLVPKPDHLKQELTEAVISGYGAFLAAGTPAEALQRLEAFRVLCALRHGPYGTEAVNALIEEILARRGLIDSTNRWYPGRPVMVTVNDYNLNLFNGDVGVVMHDSDSGGLRVFFPGSGGAVRKVFPVRLPEHETVFAMTIHKSQGSEFDRVLMILPSRDLELLTRELVYTGLTRARREVEIWTDESVLARAVERRIERSSGLADVLWPRR